MSVDVDVAIVAYRKWELTRSCLEHLRRQTLAHRVIVCDNGCDQGTAERLRESYPEVTVVRRERNDPRNQIAYNLAVAAGRGAIVVTMNNDVDAHPEFLERACAPFAGRPRLGSVAPLLLRPGERRIDSAGLAADPTLSAFPRLKGREPGEACAERPVLAGPDGAAAAFRRVAWVQLGGLDETLHYMADFDLALRLRIAGWETALAADAVAVHVGSATYGHRSRRLRYMAGFGRAYMMRRYGVLRSRAALRALVTEGVVVAGDVVLSHDAAALAGRLAGWRAAPRSPRAPWPPPRAVDERIGFLESLRLRRGTYLTQRRGAEAG